MDILLDDPYLYRLAEIESNLNPNAQNPNSSAKGLFQFIDKTAQAYGITDPYDVNQQIAAARQFTADNQAILRNALGREPTTGELYLAHQQGATGASNLLSNPDTPASQIVGEEQVILNAGNPEMTSQEFAQNWINKFENTQPENESNSTETQYFQAPNGQIISNVPKDIKTKKGLAEFLNNSGYNLDDLGMSEFLPEITTNSENENISADTQYFQAPNGQMIKNVPKNIQTKKDLAEFLNNSGYNLDDLGMSETGEEIIPLRQRDFNESMQAYKSGQQSLPETAFQLVSNVGMGTMGDVVQDVASLAGQGVLALTPDPIEDAIARSGKSALELIGSIPTTGGQTLGQRATSAIGGAQSQAENFAQNNPRATRNIRALGNFSQIVPFAQGAKGAENLINLARRSQQTPNVSTPNLTLSPAAMESLNEQPLMRSNILEQAGIPQELQTAAMISRDPRQWQFERNTMGIQGVGDELQNRYVQANQILRENLEDIGVSIGGTATTSFEAGEKVVDAVIKKSNEMQKEIGELYKKVETDVGDEIGMIPDNLLDTINNLQYEALAADWKGGDSIIGKMKSLGVIDVDENPIKAMTVTEAERLRQFINKISDKNDNSIKLLKSDFISALDDDVIDTAGVEAYKQARDAARGRFQEFFPRELARSRPTTLQQMVEGSLVADDILQKTVFGGRVNDLRKLKESLLTGTDEQIVRGSEAWSDLKLQTLQKVIDRSTSNQGRGALSGNTFTKELNKIGKERLETIFDPDELLKLRTIEKALEYTTVEVPFSAVNYSGTGAAVTNNFLSGIIQQSKLGEALEGAGAAMTRVPVVGTVSGLAARGVGQGLQNMAKDQSIRRSLNPMNALREYARTRNNDNQ